MTAISQAEHIAESCTPSDDLSELLSMTLSIPMLQDSSFVHIGKKSSLVIYKLAENPNKMRTTIYYNMYMKVVYTDLKPRVPSKVHRPICEQIFCGCV